VKVKGKIKARLLIVFEDCKIECPKIEVQKIIRLKRD
jgi:hypothetical protein